MSVVPVRRAFAAAAIAALSTFAATTVSVAPAAAAPSPVAPGAPRATGMKGEDAERLAKSWAERIKVRSKAGAKSLKAVTLTSPPTVVTLTLNPSKLATLVVANAGGTAVSRVQYADERGWTPWYIEGEGIAGQPQWGFETQELAIYARTTAGRLVRSTLDQGWLDQGISTDRDPVTFTNRGNDNFQVYVVGTNGAVYERYQRASDNSWSGWGNMGGNVTTGTVAPYFNEYNDNVSVFINSGDALSERWWNSKTGAWSGWGKFKGKITSTPVPHFNGYNGNTQIYANRDGDIVEVYWNRANGAWSGWGDFNGNATGEPAVIQNYTTFNVQLYANTGGKVSENYWAPGRPWSGWNAYPGSVVIAGTPSVTYNPHHDRIQLLATTSTGDLAENFWSPGKPWSGWNVLPSGTVNPTPTPSATP